MYFIGLFFIIFKGIIFYLDKFLLSFFSIKSLIILIFLLSYLITLYKKKKKIAKYYKDLIKNPTVDTLADHIMTYRWKSNLTILLWIYILGSLSFLYFIGILSLRIKNIENILDLKKIGKDLLSLYNNFPISLFLMNILILILFIIAFVWTISLIKKYLLKIIMSLHFYFAEEGSYYQKKFDKLAFTTILYKIKSYFLKFEDFVDNIGFFFFKLKFLQNDESLENIYYKKYGYISLFIRNFCNFMLYNLHYLFLIFIIFYDIYYNNMILKNVTYYLPFMFIYHTYVIYCNFVLEKRIYGLVSSVNKMFYHDVIIIGNLMIIDGVAYEVDPEFGINFLKYELRNFTEPNK